MFFVFFFQAEDGIRDADVTGVQTCALPISPVKAPLGSEWQSWPPISTMPSELPANCIARVAGGHTMMSALSRSVFAPATILQKSSWDAMRPFIFQLPAISGRRGVIRFSPVKGVAGATTRPIPDLAGCQAVGDRTTRHFLGRTQNKRLRHRREEKDQGRCPMTRKRNRHGGNNAPASSATSSTTKAE